MRTAPAQPRVRGERRAPRRLVETAVGSAPRARGTEPIQRPGLPRRRLSPACAGNGVPVANTPRPTTAQPRVRGERHPRQHTQPLVVGSAPRARGTVAAAFVAGSIGRLSPACAGNGSARRRRPRSAPAQPRVRGERGARPEPPCDAVGSAPRARGTAVTPPPRRRRSRLSPACAGNGGEASARSVEAPAQPRVRGERVQLAPARLSSLGSAPRARGTGPRRLAHHQLPRLSPACAGNGGERHRFARMVAAQSRVRGERSAAVCGTSPAIGSAPRARGTGAHEPAVDPRHRLSPACAGNGRRRAVLARRPSAQPRVRGERQPVGPIAGGGRWAPSPAATTAQPRVRGERSKYTPESLISRGSAPRARGTGGLHRAPPAMMAAQPRVRGERCALCPGIPLDAGSAPRARGTGCGPRWRPGRWRLITGSAPRARGTASSRSCSPGARRLSPACAGNGARGVLSVGEPAAQPRVRGERS